MRVSRADTTPSLPRRGGSWQTDGAGYRILGGEVAAVVSPSTKRKLRKMAWTIRLRYVPEHDFVLTSYTDVILRDEKDTARWRREVSAQFREIGRGPVDVIIDLKGLIVKPSAGAAYGEHRT